MLTSPSSNRLLTIDTMVKCHPYHFNSMREKPTDNPIARIENNLTAVRPFPNNWVRSYDEWHYFKHDKQFRMRCLFDANENAKQIHLRSIDSLTNQHLLDQNLTKKEDDIFQALGAKRVHIDKRNELAEYSPGDKSYKAVEYSPLYFGKNTHSRNPIKRQRIKKEITDLNQLLNIRPSSTSSINRNDFDYDVDEAKNAIYEVNNIKSLNEWKPAAPLKPPFKVLDLDEKAVKYRPKVTK
jgi:hypothetical protein